MRKKMKMVELLDFLFPELEFLKEFVRIVQLMVEQDFLIDEYDLE
jgi:hypothetical protein